MVLNRLSIGGPAVNTLAIAHQLSRDFEILLLAGEPLPQEESAAYMLVAATAYRMLHHWKPNDVKPGDVVLIWGGAGGLGAMAIQIVKAAGGIPIAVVSSDDKIDFCKKLGAAGVINRNKFKHWGAITTDINKMEVFGEWTKQAREFGKDYLGYCWKRKKSTDRV